MTNVQMTNDELQNVHGDISLKHESQINFTIDKN